MKQTKTFAFDPQGEFLLARPSKDWAIRSVRRIGKTAFFFTEQEVKKDKHLRFFKNLKKHQA
jgi:hypothetical protein